MSLRAAIYCRISRDREGAGLGVERQEADCRTLAEQLGWSVLAVHVDNDVSASSGRRRPGYAALLDDLRAGRADAVIAWHSDRLHRRPVELEEFLGVVEERGVALRTVRAGEVDLSTPSGRAIARTLGAWSRHEVEHAAARITRAKTQAAAEGRFRGGRRAFGYEADGMTVRPAEARTVQDATTRVLVGESLRSVARDLNARGVTTSTGGRWTPVEIRRVVTRPRNAGLIEHHGAIVGQAQWPAIVDVDTWRAVRAVVNDPSRRHPATRLERFLGSGLFLCGVCADGTTMLSASTHGARKARHPAYRCRAGSHLSRMVAPVDELVTRVVLGRLGQPDARLLLRTENGVDVAALQDRGNTLRGRLDELSGLFAAGEIDGRQLSTGTTSLRAQLDTVERELSATVGRSPLAGFADTTSAAELDDAWHAAPIGRRKAIIRELLTVTLHKAPPGRQPDGSYFNPSCVQITWRTP